MFYCKECNKDFKRKDNYDRHLKSKLHTSKSDSKFICRCGKRYTHSQGLSRHKQICSFNLNAERKTEHEIEIEEFKQKMIQKDVKIESYKKEIECLKGTILCQKELIQTLEKQIRYGGTMIKSANRRKISPKVRKEIVDQQESKCGGCEAALTEYYEIDHIIGLQFGGTNDTTNLMALCCECHAKKSINENKNRNKIKEAILTILT